MGVNAMVAALLIAAAASDSAPASTGQPELQQLRAAGLRGDRWEAQLNTVLDRNPALRRPLARALIRKGPGKCIEVQQGMDCNGDREVIGTLEPGAGFDDPCLQRALVQWALRSAKLEAKDVKELLDSLVAIVTLPEPENELPDDALQLAEQMPDKIRLRLLMAARPEHAEHHLAGLSQRSLATLVEQRHLDEAALALDPERSLPAILGALSNIQLSHETREKLLREVVPIEKPAVRKALAEAAGTDCRFSMTAALALEKLGDASKLPTRPAASKGASDDVRKLAFEMCRLSFDPDVVRARSRLAEFLPRKGKVRFVTVPLGEEPKTETCTRSSPDSCMLPTPKEPFEFECSDDSCTIRSDEFDIVIDFSKGPRRFIKRIEYRDESYRTTC